MSRLAGPAIHRRCEQLLDEMRTARVAHTDRAVFAAALLGHVLRAIPAEENVVKVIKLVVVDLFGAYHGRAFGTALAECADELVAGIVGKLEAPRDADGGPRVLH